MTKQILVGYLLLFSLQIFAQELRCYAKEDKFWSFKTYDNCELCLEKHEKCIDVCEKQIWEATAVHHSSSGAGYAYIKTGETRAQAEFNALNECRLWNTFGSCFIQNSFPKWVTDSVTKCE